MAYGSALSLMEDAPASRKSRGAFFTPPELAAYLADWAISSPSDKVLEPACGEAQFLIASYERLVSLGASSQVASKQITGCELHEQSAKAALSRCKQHGFCPLIKVGDFFMQASSEQYDVVLGNPPYVRFQVIDSKQRNSIREVTSKTGYSVSALASAWAPFVMHAAAFLKNGGKLAFVLPAELLTVNYAAPIRTFLLKEFSDISVVTFDQQVFPEVQEEVVLLLAGGYHCGSSGFIKWMQATDLSSVREAPGSDYYPGQNGERWSNGFLSAETSSILKSLDENEFCRLGDWGNVTLGTVTGNNKYFALSREELKHAGLSVNEVVRISPPGSRHLRALSLSKADFEGLVSSEKKCFVFYPSTDLSSGARQYIEEGHLQGVDTAYKCRKRKPWWRIPLTSVPDAFVTYMNDYAPSVCINEAGIYYLNSVHGLTFKNELRNLGRELFALACVNSVTLLSAELEGRSYGGGILKVEPREATKLQVPSPTLVASKRSQLLEVLGDAPVSVEGDALISLRDKVDSILFSDMPALKDGGLDQLRESKQYLYSRRRERSKK